MTWLFAILPATVVLFLLGALLTLDESAWDHRPETTTPWRGILAPSIGMPALLDSSDPAGPVFDVVIVAGDQRAVPASMKGILKPVLSGCGPLELALVSVSSVDLSSEAMSEGWADWVVKSSRAAIRARFRVPLFEGTPYLRLLCDLEVTVEGSRYDKRSAVFLSPRLDTEARLLVASDIHAATRWDDIEQQVRTCLPARQMSDPRAPESTHYTMSDLLSRETFLATFINPNRMLTTLVATANAMFDRGDIDAVLMLGDLVDHKYAFPRDRTPGGSPTTEWLHLERLLTGQEPGTERLRAPLITTTGNHDYRLYPYNLQVYGLLHCGVPTELSERYVRASGQWRTSTYRWSDLDSIRVNTGARHSLEFYYLAFNARSDFSFHAGGVRHLVLDSGPDFYCLAREFLFSRRLPHFMRSLVALESPDSAGMTANQVERFLRYLRDQPAGATALLYTHAPLLNGPTRAATRGRATDESRVGLRIPLDSDITLARELEFEKRVDRSPVGGSVVFRNTLAFLAGLALAKGPSAIVSGHVHREGVLAVVRESGEVVALANPNVLGSQLDLASRVLLMHGAALSHVERTSLTAAVPSFRVLHMNGGALVSTRSCALPVGRALPAIEFARDSLTLSMHAVPSDPVSTQPRIINILVFMLDATGRAIERCPEGFRIDIDPSSSAEVTHTRVIRERARCLNVYTVTGVDCLKLRIDNWPRRVRLAVATETFERTSEGYCSLGLVWHRTSRRPR